VSGYEAQCPSCGAAILFELGSTVVRICDHCQLLVVRKGADIQSLGKVASLIPTPSVLALGMSGGYQGAPPFRLIGRLQLDHGAGTWDEWLMGFQQGSWTWLSEAQGRFHYMASAPLPPLPEFSELRAGRTVDLGPPGTFVVTEVRRARFMSGAGELPFAVTPGAVLHYADLSGPRGAFATLDYGEAGVAAEALYVGRETRLADLGLKPVAAEARRKQTKTGGLSCPNCAGPLEIRAPDQTQRVACPWCGSLLDATNDLAVLDALAKVEVTPRIPLGSKGRLEDVEWTLIGFMERSVRDGGIRYPWQEYLLYEPANGFRWLVESKGHWSFVTPINPGDVSAFGSAYNYDGQTFKPFQGGKAIVDHVLGEFYWAVKRGEEVETQDFVSPPLMLSAEGTEQEIVWSCGKYLTGAEVWSAFQLPGGPPPAEGIAPHQPSPFTGRVGKLWKMAALALVLLVSCFTFFCATGGREVYKQAGALPNVTDPNAPEAAIFTPPFQVERHGNLQVEVNAPVSNSWLYLSGALINEDTGAFDEFDLEVSYYSGADSDGSWTEGSTRSTASIGNVPPGRYVLRLAPQWEANRKPASYDLRVVSGVPSIFQALLATMLLFAWPLIVSVRSGTFEARRWAESDQLGGGSDDDDDDDDSSDSDASDASDSSDHSDSADSSSDSRD
jgi:uncharacterized protein DUF4178